MEGRVPHYYAMSLNESFKDRWHLRWTTNVKSLLDKGLTYPHNASSETFKFLIVQYCQSKFSILTLLHPNSLLNSKCYYMLRSERHPKAVYYFYIEWTCTNTTFPLFVQPFSWIEWINQCVIQFSEQKLYHTLQILNKHFF